MTLTITLFGNPVLRRKGAKIDEVTPEISKLIDDMIETMHKANGVGLAAQQVDKALQLCVIDIPEDIERGSRMWVDSKQVDLLEYMPMVLINPEISITKKKEIDYEGCLSFPEIGADISRGARVKVKALDRHGNELEFEAAGLLGRAVQHEVDHLNGVLFTDHMQAEDKSSLKPKIEEIREQGIEQAKASP